MSIYIIILNWNGKKDTIECLKSVENLTTSHKVVVVDNGSTDGSQKEIKKRFPGVHLIETGKNLGYAEGNNVGIRYALKEGADFLFILNNDTILTKTILEDFLKKDLPIQGGKTLLMDEPFLIDHLGGMWNPEKKEFDLIALHAPKEKWVDPITLDYVCGVALFVKREVFEKVGLFDPRFFLFWEEADWCYRAKNLGYPITVCPEAILFHKKSASFIGGKPHINYFWWRNRLLFIEKNLPLIERKRLKKEIHKEARHTLKLFLIKSLLFKKKKQRFYRSLLAGVRDYHLRRFGPCPKWLLRK